MIVWERSQPRKMEELTVKLVQFYGNRFLRSLFIISMWATAYNEQSPSTNGDNNGVAYIHTRAHACVLSCIRMSWEAFQVKREIVKYFQIGDRNLSFWHKWMSFFSSSVAAGYCWQQQCALSFVVVDVVVSCTITTNMDFDLSTHSSWCHWKWHTHGDTTLLSDLYFGGTRERRVERGMECRQRKWRLSAQNIVQHQR